MSQSYADADDASLLDAVRHGNGDAYGVLYRRHAVLALAYARRFTHNADDAGDVVAESFARLLSVLQRGLGPIEEFRPYLMRTVRNLAFDRSRADRRIEFTDQMSLLECGIPFRDVVLEKAERALVARAFASLPPRWQKVLWLTCVEGSTVESASGVLGTNTNALTSLAYRAREGLRQAYLQANVPPPAALSCAPFNARLGAHVRGALGPTLKRRLESHVADCAGCGRILDELVELNATLREQVGLPTRGGVTTSAPAVEDAARTAQISRDDGNGWAPIRVA